MPESHDYLGLIGVDAWVRRDYVVPGSEAPPSGQGGAVPAADPASGFDPADWSSLESAVSGCTRCELSGSRKQTVFGTGDRGSRWLVVGEAPGAEEDKRGEPFVGRAGQLLSSMLQAIGLERDQVFITNILKCRPPKNRDPRPAEAAACAPYLRAQIDLLAPAVIIAVGRVAAQNLLRIDTPIGRMRGKRYEYADTGIPVVVTYHPAYLLRSPGEKAKAWQDLCMARSIMQEQEEAGLERST